MLNSHPMCRMHFQLIPGLISYTGVTRSVGITHHARETQMAGPLPSQSHSLVAYCNARLLLLRPPKQHTCMNRLVLSTCNVYYPLFMHWASLGVRLPYHYIGERLPYELHGLTMLLRNMQGSYCPSFALQLLYTYMYMYLYLLVNFSMSQHT